MPHAATAFIREEMHAGGARIVDVERPSVMAQPVKWTTEDLAEVPVERQGSIENAQAANRRSAPPGDCRQRRDSEHDERPHASQSQGTDDPE